MKTLDRINTLLNRLLIAIGGLFLLAMIGMTCANIVTRMFWTPIRGTYELMGFSGAILSAFALAYTQHKKGHIAVDVLVNAFPQRVQHILRVINHGACGVFFLVAAWQMALKARTLMQSGEVTETLRIIYYPFTYAVAFGCLVLALRLLTDLLHLLRAVKVKEVDA